MSNFKSGSGDLDFGGSDESDDAESGAAPEEKTTEETETTASSETAGSESSSGTSTTRGQASETAESEATTDTDSVADYPYFVRRNNVGDERDTRLEIHVRDKVADQEAAFRNELAGHLDANEVSKTDAREFALLAAYQNPELVAELMREDGFGTL